VSLGVTLSRVSGCPPTARHISLGGEGNALYPVLASCTCLSLQLSHKIPTVHAELNDY